MASRLAVYASLCGSPHHNARLAYDCSAQLYHVGLSPTGLLQRISTLEFPFGCVPPLQACLAQEVYCIK
jgi:hypothetical protein